MARLLKENTVEDGMVIGDEAVKLLANVTKMALKKRGSGKELLVLFKAKGFVTGSDTFGSLIKKEPLMDVMRKYLAQGRFIRFCHRFRFWM